MELENLVEKLRQSLNGGVKWLKCEGGKFLVQGVEIGSALDVVIVEEEFSYVRWADGVAEKLSEREALERGDLKGFAPQLTLKMRSEESLFGLTISQISMERFFLPYLSQLQAAGLELTQVVTRLSADVKAGRQINFGIVKFSLVKPLDAAGGAAAIQ